MAEEFNIRPVYVDFLNTLDEKLSSSDVGSEIHVSRKESCDGPISEVNWQNYPTFSHQSKGTCYFIFCDQRTFVIMHNL